MQRSEVFLYKKLIIRKFTYKSILNTANTTIKNNLKLKTARSFPEVQLLPYSDFATIMVGIGALILTAGELAVKLLQVNILISKKVMTLLLALKLLLLLFYLSFIAVHLT
ncbi:MAG: hypothetical protein ACI9ES_002236 [Oceanospirillaceae bacterium]|jgi:hypothetical protein